MINAWYPCFADSGDGATILNTMPGIGDNGTPANMNLDDMMKAVVTPGNEIRVISS